MSVSVLLLILAALGVLLWAFLRARPGDVAEFIKSFAAMFGVLASSGLLYFGRFGLAIITIAATILTIRSIRRKRRPADRFRQAGEAGTSEAETSLLSMSLDRSAGEVDGFVKKGKYEGKRLHELTMKQLLELRIEAENTDQLSLDLLEAYLDHRFSDWRGSDFDGSGAGDGKQGHANDGETPMDRARALEILGLADGASDRQIIERHRKLMHAVHPDRGGSDHLAKEINQARDTLLRRSGAK